MTMAKRKDKKTELKELEEQTEKTKKEVNEALQLAGKAGICAYCNETFEMKRNTQRFCSDKCRVEWWKRKTSSSVRELTCPVCGTKFSTNDGRRGYCSKECYLKANNERAKLRYKE